ncbi:UNVERIFIED_CONTAM: hypothetical protein OHV15_17225 [Microbacterium sp. SLM126]
MEWIGNKDQVEIPLFYESREVQVSHSFAGRLLRLLMQYDRLFAETLYGLNCESIPADARENTTAVAAKRIKAIQQLCIPDTDKFAPDGTLLNSSRSQNHGHA